MSEAAVLQNMAGPAATTAANPSDPYERQAQTFPRLTDEQVARAKAFGRIQDLPNHRLKTALRKVTEQFKPEVRLTASQNILLVNIPGEQRAAVETILRDQNVSVENPFSPTRLASMACPATRSRRIFIRCRRIARCRMRSVWRRASTRWCSASPRSWAR